MSTIALNGLLNYILSLSLSDSNKDWLASKIIESKTSSSEDLYSLFGAWGDDTEIDVMEQAIREGRTSGKTRDIISFDQI